MTVFELELGKNLCKYRLEENANMALGSFYNVYLIELWTA